MPTLNKIWFGLIWFDLSVCNLSISSFISIIASVKIRRISEHAQQAQHDNPKPQDGNTIENGSAILAEEQNPIYIEMTRFVFVFVMYQ